MKGILICGHGHFATGILSGLEMIVGSTENVRAVDFTPEDTPETIQGKLKVAIRELESYPGLVVFSDLAGGTPFQMVSLILKGTGTPVFAGSSQAMILEVFQAEDPEPRAMDAGHEGIKMLKV